MGIGRHRHEGAPAGGASAPAWRPTAPTYPAARVRGDDGDVDRLCKLDERPVVGAVVGPRPRVLQEVRLTDLAGEVLVEHGLRVALEHLEREGDALAARGERDEQVRLERVRDRVVVALAEEDDVARLGRIEHVASYRLARCAAEDAKVGGALRGEDGQLRGVLARELPRAGRARRRPPLLVGRVRVQVLAHVAAPAGGRGPPTRSAGEPRAARPLRNRGPRGGARRA